MKKSWLFNVALLLVCVLCVQASRAQDDNPFDLPEGALARLGKGAIGKGDRAVAYSSDGTLLAVGSSLGIWLYDAHTYTEVALLPSHTNSVVFSPDGEVLASVTGSWTVLLWNVSRRTLRTVIEGRTQIITSVAFSPDGKTIASVTNASVTSSVFDAIRLWDVDGGAVKAYIKGPSVWDDAGWSFSVTFAPDGKTLATGSDDYTVRLWEVESGTLKTSLKGHTGQVSSVVFSPDGKTIASASWDSTVRLWEVESGTPKAILEGHTDRINSVAFSPDGKTIASGSDDHTVRLWDVESGAQKASIEGHTNRVSSVAFAPDGKTLASVSWAYGESYESWHGKVWLWDVDSRTLKASIKDHTGPVSSVAFSPDGKTIASASDDHTVRLWDVESGAQKASLKGRIYEVLSVAFSPDGKTIAGSSWDNTVQLWDVESGAQKTSIEGHSEWSQSAPFSPDGKTIAGSSWGNTVQLWDVESGAQKASLKGHIDEVLSVAFAPDGKTLASGSYDGTILLWDMSPYITPSTPTAIELSPPLPTQTALLANFPNPFNPDTYIPYQLHAPAQVRLSIYDIRGALIRELDLGYRTAGSYLTSTNAAHWDGRDHRGERVASGVYLYRLQAGPVAQVRKMVLVK